MYSVSRVVKRELFQPLVRSRDRTGLGPVDIPNSILDFRRLS